MNEKVENLILEHIGAMRADIARMSSEMAELRGKIAELRSPSESPQAIVSRLWFEGLASGDAGSLDDVFDEVLARVPSSGPRL